MIADPSTPAEDGGPVLEQNGATDEEKIAGIIAQTRVDLGDESVERYADVIGQRFSDSGIEASDDELRGHAEKATGSR